MKNKRSRHEHTFSEIESVQINRSVFQRNHGVKTSFDAGKLVPIFIDEMLPGDTINLNASLYVRMATPFQPLMDNLYLDTHWFFVPNRLIWDNWEDFITGSDDTLLMPVIQMASNQVLYHQLADYFGIPQGSVDTDEICALPFRAYNLIYNEWYRDQNLIDPIVVDTDDGPDAGTDYTLRTRAKRHDYFTSCLPWPQKGDEILLPIGDSAPVIGDGNAIQFWDGSQHLNLLFDTNQATLDVYSGAQRAAGLPRTTTVPSNVDDILGLSQDSGLSGMYADLSEATAKSINSIREAFQLQKMLERDARTGSRYVENIKAHFGVQLADYRAQRPEYLGGSSRLINITPVAQTSEDNSLDERYIGDLGAIVNVQDQARINKSFTEYGYVIGLASVRTELNYQQGLDRMWSRQTRYDHYWPTLAHLGEQEVLNKEIYYQADKSGANEDNEVFGYNERYSEYRYKRSMITGLMSSVAALSLDTWHLAQSFSSKPQLNESFIQEDPPMARVLAVNWQADFIGDIYYDYRHTRPMPTHGTPGYVDHF